MRLDRLRNHTARVDALQLQSLELIAEVLEIPPGNAVLCADDNGVWAEERPQRRRKRGKCMRLDAEKHHVRLADRREIARDLRPNLEVTLVGADHPKAAF